MNSELVSAVITTHERPEMLQRAVESVLRQTYENLEIIIVDDGSRDHTDEVAKRFTEEFAHVRYLKLEESRGACAARNRGVGQASGAFVSGLDDDDEWLPQRIELLMEAFDDRFAYVCSRNFIVSRGQPKIRPKKYLPTINMEDMLSKNITGNQILTKRERILAVGGFDEKMTAAQDYDLWIRLIEAYGPARMIREPLQIVHREHLSGRVSVSKNKLRGDTRFFLKHKNKMNRTHRRRHIVKLKKLKQENLSLCDVFVAHNSEMLLNNMRYYAKRKIKWWALG